MPRTSDALVISVAGLPFSFAGTATRASDVYRQHPCSIVRLRKERPGGHAQANDGNSTTGTVTAGLLTKVENNIDATTKATTTMTYDNWGNVLTIQDPRVNASEYQGTPPPTAQIVYDTTYHSLVTSTTNALSQTTSTTYEGHLWPQSVTDPNNQVTSWTYDKFGRTLTVAAPLDDLTSPTTTISYTDAVAAPFSPASVTSAQKTSNTSAPVTSVSYLDGLGRTFQTKNQNVGTNWTTADVYFDAQGRVFKEGVPYLTNTASYTVRQSNPIATELTFDTLGRVTQVKHPDTTTSQTQYAQTKVTSIDENNHVSVTEVDASNPRSAFKKTYTGTYPNQVLYATTTVKAYAGKSQIVDNAGNVITSTTDLLGRRLTYSDPDMGNWSYAYDVNSNLKQQTDAKSQVIDFTYDKLNRLLDKKNGATTLATYGYDSGTNGIGRLSATTYNRGNDSFTYDVRGRVTQIQRTLDSITKTFQATYDSADRKATQTYPDGEVLTYDYGTDGAMTGFHSGLAIYLSNVTYNPLGQITSQLYGNTVTTNFTYYDDGTNDPNTQKNHSYRLKQILAGTGNAVQNITYRYDMADNVASKIDGNDGTKSETYGYDPLDRLTSWTVNNVTQNYTYDELNRIKSKEGSSYSYYTNQPHQIQTFGSNNYTFDANGSMLTRSDGRTLSYDVLNRVTSISDGGTYSYGTGRQRTIKTEGTKTTYYFFPGNYEEEYTSGTLSNTIKYYGGIAERSSTPQGLVYVHSDHLGSSSVVTDASGTIVKKAYYKPYGEVVGETGAFNLKQMFTGYERESAVGLNYANARYYDAQLGMFTQVDPIHQGQNPFAYCFNNPINFTDPTGLICMTSADGHSYNTGTETGGGGGPNPGETHGPNGIIYSGYNDPDHWYAQVPKGVPTPNGTFLSGPPLANGSSIAYPSNGYVNGRPDSQAQVGVFSLPVTGTPYKHTFIGTNDGHDNVHTYSLYPSSPVAAIVSTIPLVDGGVPSLKTDYADTLLGVDEIGAAEDFFSGNTLPDGYTMEGLIATPPNTTPADFADKVKSKAGAYPTKDRNYKALDGPNSNTYASSVIEGAGGAMPSVDGAQARGWAPKSTMQQYQEYRTASSILGALF